MTVNLIAQDVHVSHILVSCRVISYPKARPPRSCSGRKRAVVVLSERKVVPSMRRPQRTIEATITARDPCGRSRT
jgi:hypothetical protein